MHIEKPRQSFGKRLAKLFLPVLIGLNVPFLCIEIDSLLNPIDLDKAGKFAMEGSQAFDYILVPVAFLILLLVQGLIIIPAWNRICWKYRRVLLSSWGKIIFSSFFILWLILSESFLTAGLPVSKFTISI